MEPAWIIVHGGALGDLALTIQLALSLGAARAGDRLDVLSRADPGDLSAYRPRVVRRSLEGIGAHALYAEDDAAPSGPIAEALRGRRVLNALGDEATIVHRRIAAIAARVVSFDPRPRAGLREHITSQWRGDILAQGFDDTDARPECVHLEHAGEAESPRLVLIHPGSGSAAKCWALDAFVAVARALRGAGRGVEFVLGPAERERWSRETCDALAGEFACAWIEDASALTARLSRTAVLLGNDSGPSHLAALLGVPTVTLFGPTDARVWRPLGPRAQVLVGDPSADPRTWGLGVERVLAAIDVAAGPGR